MRRLPKDYSITRADVEEIEDLILIDLAAGTLFADTGLISDDGLMDHVPDDVFRDAINVGDVFVARERHGAPVGFTVTSERGGGLYLDQVSVHPEHGKNGIGTALVKRVIEDAKDRKFKRVALSTFRDLKWNGPFYKSLGFREIKDSKMEPWMQELKAVQSRDLDVSKRCFMQKKVGWL